jgi:hypothetical protein
MKYVITKDQYEKLMRHVEPSDVAQKSICDSEKFCSAQGKITFGQLKALVESATSKRIYKHIGEGGFKATLRLIPWFLPQLSLAGFIASSARALNKILRPTITETTNYRTWWGKAVMKSFDLAEGELNLSDPFSRIFFISDGLMTMLDDRYKLKFAKYVSDIASLEPDDKEVPEFFVENELRRWLNEKFLLDPPLAPKTKIPKRKLKIAESVITEQFNPDRLYPKDYILRVLKTAPKEFKSIKKQLQDIPCSNDKGEETVCTKIPEFLHVYLTGRY